MTYYVNGTKNHACISVLIIIDTNLHHISLTIAGYDYIITTSTLKFEPSTEITSQRQCLEIETIEDSLPEYREALTLLLSTNSSAVRLNTPKVDTFIRDIGGKYRKVYLHEQCIDI